MRAHSCLLTLSLIASPIVANAATVTFQEGIAGYNGTLTRAVFSRNPDMPFASHDLTTDGLRIDRTTNAYGPGSVNGIAQGLIRFDDIFNALTIPAGATITSATLRFRTFDPTPNTISLYRMTSDWNSATTWNTLSNGIDLGIDALAIADASRTGVALGFAAFDITGSLQAWLGGASNFGWAILSNGGNAWDFRTESYGTTPLRISQRPLLTVNFTVPPTSPVPVPGALWLMSGALVFVVARGRRRMY